MTDLVEFLLARLAEDEAVARVALAGDDGVRDAPHFLGPNLVEYLAHYDPARVLAEVEAKRQIVELHEPDAEHNCSECGTGVINSGPGDPGDFNPTPWPCQTLRLMASVDADHENYDPSWAPS